jgi:hypothetical protein
MNTKTSLQISVSPLLYNIKNINLSKSDYMAEKALSEENYFFLFHMHCIQEEK